MEQNIKNRLVGIIVVFALAVIFLPMILDGSGVRKDKFDIVIPPQPEVDDNADLDAKIIELNSRVDAIPELQQRFVDEASSENQVQRSTSKSEDSTKVRAKAEPIPPPQPKTPAAPASGGDSWVLQVGSFQDRGKALTQRDLLRKSNIAAVFIEKFNVNNKPSYRVRLGPFINREQTRVAQNKIKAKHDIDGIIMKYER
jgi:DedD protein